MKIIITESQSDNLSLEKRADIIYKLIKTLYPKNEISLTKLGDYDVYDNHDEERLLFYFKPKFGEFYMGALVLNELYKITGLPFFEYQNIKENRSTFDEVMKIFARKYYGWRPSEIFFHFY